MVRVNEIKKHAAARLRDLFPQVSDWQELLDTHVGEQTVDLLVRGDTDATLVLGADPGATMPQPAIDHLKRTPTIVLDPKVTHTSQLARVHITTAATGISAPGTVYRMDEVPLPLRPILQSPYPTDEEVVRRIAQAVAAKPPWFAGDDLGIGTN